MKKMLSQVEVCKLLSIHYSTLNRMLNAGEFVVPLFGRKRKLVFDPDTVEAWIKSRQSSPVIVPHAINPTKKQQQEEKAYRERQEAACAALERHRKSKRQQNKATQDAESACAVSVSTLRKKGISQ